MNFESTIPHDGKIYEKAIDRARNSHVDLTSEFDVVVFLEKEIDRYRDKIGHLESYIEELNHKNAILSYGVETGKNHIKKLKARLNSVYGTSQLEAVQEKTTAEIIKALAENGYNTITINCYKTERED